MRIQNPQLRELFKTPQRKTYTTLVLTLVTVGVLIFFTIRPTFIKIADLRKELKDKKTFLERIDKKQRNLNYLIDEKASFTNELDIFSKNLPEEIKGGFIVANLSEIANLQNVD
jgi:Tfp pilus assembly protein PilO